MSKYRIIDLNEEKELCDKAALWFHEKWHIATNVYKESILESFKDNVIPKWYVALDGNDIIGGLGVIENDFHERKELTPNVCAVYVDSNYRKQGIAGELLNYVCDDMRSKGIDTLYLLTDHIGFYERYGWEFLCMVKSSFDSEESRMYVHKNR